jgi:hypothetical protein
MTKTEEPGQASQSRDRIYSGVFSMFRISVFLLLLSFPSSALAWDYSLEGYHPRSLLGGTRGSLTTDHPKESNNEFGVDKKGQDVIYFDDEEAKSTTEIWVKTPNQRGNCTWYFYRGALKFQDKYFLGVPVEQYESDCNKP